MKAILMIFLGVSLGTTRGVDFNPPGQHSIQQKQQQEQQQEQNQHDRRKQELVSENNLSKLMAKKSVQDEDTIQAAQGYEFQHLPESSPDHSSSQVVEFKSISSAGYDEHDYHHHPKVGYSVGGPLVNIAQGAAAQAHTFEKSQPVAAAQAAYVAKNRLGQSAGLSAATAAAAFAGKQIILRGLEQQAYSAHRSLESEKLQLQQAQRAATAAAHAAQQAIHQVQVITTALNAAQTTSEHTSAAATASASELAAQTAMVGAAKARLQTIEDQLYHARIDFEATQHANFKAAHAAQVAQNNAAAAAAHAAKIANTHHNRYHYQHDHNLHRHGKNDYKHRHLKHHHHDKHKDHDKLKHDHNEQEHEHENDYDHEYGHEHDQEHEQEHNHDRQESIFPLSSSLISTTLSSISLPASASSTVKNIGTERSRQVLHPTSQNFPRVMTTVSSIGKDEFYDVYDNFPY